MVILVKETPPSATYLAPPAAKLIGSTRKLAILPEEAAVACVIIGSTPIGGTLFACAVLRRTGMSTFIADVAQLVER